MLSPDDVAALVHEQYARLPKTGKPQAGEWTVLAGIVLATPSSSPYVVALGTGTKCLTAAQIGADGVGECLHDSHAEVCARRAFLAFLLHELQKAGSGSEATSLLQPRREAADAAARGAGFELRPGVELHFYTSEAPCGDAAIFDLCAGGDTVAAKPAADDGAGQSVCPLERPLSEDPQQQEQQAQQTLQGQHADGCVVAKRARIDEPTPPTGTSSATTAIVAASASASASATATQHRTGARPASLPAMEAEAATGGAQCALGLVRTKPGRGARTSCMSCSDKLTRWCTLGVQGGLLALLLPDPIVFTSIAVGGACSMAALARALARGGAAGGARLGATSARFESAPPPGADADLDAHTCSNSILWSASGLSEAVNGLSGKRLGANKKNPSPKHRSSVCKARLLEDFRDVLSQLAQSPSLPPELSPQRIRVVVEEHGGAQPSAQPTAQPTAQLTAQPTAQPPAQPLAQPPTRTAADGTSRLPPAHGPSLPQDRSLNYSYSELKALAQPYQQRKAAFLARPKLGDWLQAPRSCEAFDSRCQRCEGVQSAPFSS